MSFYQGEGRSASREKHNSDLEHLQVDGAAVSHFSFFIVRLTYVVQRQAIVLVPWAVNDDDSNFDRTALVQEDETLSAFFGRRRGCFC